MYLHDHGGFKDHKHDQGKDGVVPVLIKAPEGNAKELKDKEGSDGMLLKKFTKSGKGDLEAIRSIFSLGLSNGLGREETLGGMKEGHGDGAIAGLLKLLKDLFILIPDVLFLMEQEGDFGVGGGGG